MKLTFGYYSDITQRAPKQALEYAVTAEKEVLIRYGPGTIFTLGSTPARNVASLGSGSEVSENEQVE